MTRHNSPYMRSVRFTVKRTKPSCNWYETDIYERFKGLGCYDVEAFYTFEKNIRMAALLKREALREHATKQGETL